MQIRETVASTAVLAVCLLLASGCQPRVPGEPPKDPSDVEQRLTTRLAVDDLVHSAARHGSSPTGYYSFDVRELAATSRYKFAPSAPSCINADGCGCAHFGYEFVGVSDREANSKEARLQRLANGGLFGCYFLRREDGTSEQRCKFVHAPKLGKRRSLTEIATPAARKWLKLTANAKVGRVWLEGDVAISIDNANPTSYAPVIYRPVLVIDELGASSAIEVRGPKANFDCSDTPAVGELLFDGSRCDNKVGCVTAALDAFTEKIGVRMPKPKTGATSTITAGVPVGERWFRRTQKKSLILGRPWHEKSTYRFRIIVKGPSEVLEALTPPYNIGIFSSEGPYVHGEMQVALGLSENINGNYKKPETTHQEAYEKEIVRVTKYLVTQVCRELKGRMVGRKCQLK